tara:strand:- start:23421 stop:23804 length:384 start_codon:yes stop_codon:yes gene_type:complete
MDNNILSVLIAVFKFIEANEIKTVADLEGKMLSSDTQDESVLEWNYCISAESLGRYLKDNEIETQLEWDNHADEVSKCLMYDDIDNFADIRYALDKIEEYKSSLNSVYHSLDDLVSTTEGIRDEADI